MANLINDTFIIKAKYHANSEDSNNLTKLYLPIMGIDAFSLYNILLTLDEGVEYTYKNVLDLLSKFNFKTLNQSLDKLEGFGLVKTYYHKDKGFLHEIFPPMSKDEFLNNEVLRGILIGKIGEDAVKKLSVKKEYKGYKEVTKKFSEVYTVTSISDDVITDSVFKNTIDIDNCDFNYPLFISVCEGFLPDYVLRDKSFEKHMMNIAYTYKLEPEELKACIEKAMIVDKNMEFDSICKYANEKFKEKYAASGPKVVASRKDEYVDSIDDPEWEGVLRSISGMSISDVLTSLSGCQPAASELVMFQKLQEQFGFSTPIINFMILLVNNEKQGELPSYNYFERIAANWKRGNVQNAYDAYKYYLARKKSPKVGGSKSYSKKVVEVPDWYDDYKKKLEAKKGEKKELSKEQKEADDAFVKEFFK